MIVQSKTLPEFRERYYNLPVDIQRRTGKQFALFADDHRHPSVQLKPVG